MDGCGQLRSLEGEVLLDNGDWAVLADGRKPTHVKPLKNKGGYCVCARPLIPGVHSDWESFFNFKDESDERRVLGESLDLFEQERVDAGQRAVIVDFVRNWETHFRASEQSFVPFSTYEDYECPGCIIGPVVTGLQCTFEVTGGTSILLRPQLTVQLWNPYNFGLQGDFRVTLGQSEVYIAVDFFSADGSLSRTTEVRLQVERGIAVKLSPGAFETLDVSSIYTFSVPAEATGFALRVSSSRERGRHTRLQRGRQSFQSELDLVLSNQKRFQRVRFQMPAMDVLLPIHSSRSFTAAYRCDDCSKNVRAPEVDTRQWAQEAPQERTTQVLFHLPNGPLDSIAHLRNLDFLKEQGAPAFQLHEGLPELHDLETVLWDRYIAQKQPLYFAINDAYKPDWVDFLRAKNMVSFASTLAQATQNAAPFASLSEWMHAVHPSGELLEAIGDTLSTFPSAFETFAYGQTAHAANVVTFAIDHALINVSTTPMEKPLPSKLLLRNSQTRNMFVFE
ncbi:MAG: hypothetical protein A2Y14_05980 [Verrucomicrobia bacterium GWF2_51_19]|nr:MAG: hypothetical protein A2Y14_05980 [Verrucomicrobia bacterium GWF2_51_19]